MSNDPQYSLARTAQKFFGEAIQCCMQGNLESLSTLLSNYLSEHPETSAEDVLEHFQSEGKTLLHVAASSGHVSIVRHLLLLLDEKPVQLVNMEDHRGFTPLMNATIAESAESMELLLEHGALPNVCNKDGATAAHFAAVDGSVPRIRLLVAKQADLSIESSSGTCLHWAAGKGQVDMLTYLLHQENVDVNRLSPDGLPAVLMAAAGGFDQAVSVLVDAGANVGYIVSGNLTLLHICAEHGMTASVRAILANESGRKCCLHPTDDGNLPLHLAAMAKDSTIIELLLPHSESAIRSDSGVLPSMADILADGAARLADWHRKHDPATAVSAQSSNPASSSASTAAPTGGGVVGDKKWHRREIESFDEPTSNAFEGDAIAWKDKGNTLFAAKSYAAACDAYTEAIRLQGNNHVLWSNRSACFLALGEAMHALQDAEVCRRLQPMWPKGCYRLAVARLELGMYEDAAVAAFEGCKLDEKNEDLKALMQKAVKLGREEHQQMLRNSSSSTESSKKTTKGSSKTTTI